MLRNESCLYVVHGVLRLEFDGHDGYIDAGAGDFVHVPAWTVHRDRTPAAPTPTRAAWTGVAARHARGLRSRFWNAD